MAADACKRLGAGKSFFAAFSPLLFVLLYLAFTFLVFIFGPLKWNLSVNAYLLVTLLVLGCMAALALGYSLNLRKSRESLCGGALEGDGFPRLGRLTGALFAAGAAFNILTVWLTLILLYSPFVNLWECLRNPGVGYVQGQSLQNLYTSGNLPDNVSRYGPLFKVLTLFSGLTALYYPLGWLSWPRLNAWLKLLFAVSLLSTALFYWIIGTQMGFGMLVFAALPVLLYRAACVKRAEGERNARESRNLKRFRAYRGVALQAVCLLLAFVLIFGGMQVARAGAKNQSSGGAGIGGANAGNVVGTHNNFTYRYGGSTNPKSSSFAATMLTFYVSHGYAGLAKSMSLPFEWTYGLNWSYGLLQLSEKYLGVTGVWERSYLYRNEQVNRWPALTYWSTLYAWLASDVTYWGVPVVMALLGVFFAAVWKDLLTRRNAMAAVVLAQLFILFVMIPANNQLFNTISAFFSSLLVLALYIFSRTQVFKRWDCKAALEGDADG